MWAVVGTARVEQRFGAWQAWVTLANDGQPSTTMLDFRTQPADADVQAAAAAFVAARNSDGADAELVQAVEDNRPAALAYQTGAQLAGRFRARYLNASRVDAAKLAYWLIERIADGTFTDTQVRNAFGLTVTQYNATKARMQTLHDQWAAVLSAQGE